MMGIGQQPLIADKVMDFLISLNYKVTIKSSSLTEDMEDKIDYFIFFDESTPFGPDKLLQIAVDVKFARTFTIQDYMGRNSLKNSKSNYVIYDPPYVANWDNEPDGLLWINTNKLKEVVENDHPIIYNSSYNDGSKYFWIYDYIKEHPEIVDKIS
jgi:hypothetical protein